MSFQDLMKQMQAQYLEDLQDQLLSLQKTPIPELQNFFHKLKGNGSTYGFPAISTLGKKYEEKFKTSSLSEQEQSSALEELQLLLTQLKTEKN